MASSALAPAVRRRLALRALAGVGDHAAQWEENREVAYHVRRRLTVPEAAWVEAVRDLRRTVEGWERFDRLKDSLAPMVVCMAREELMEVS